MGFLHLNLDIMHETCLLLHPKDLLGLLRSCRTLRDVLYSPHSRFVWKRALVNYVASNAGAISPLPPCPTDLSELKYAFLAFSIPCQHCGALIGRTDWDLRVRYCTLCEPRHITLFDATNPPILACDPTADVKQLVAIRTLTPAFLTSELATLTKKYQALDTQARAVFLARTKQQLADRYIHARLCRAWVASL
ncbi:hypothetical protein DFH07DRAFT_967632 [Mycena maculata]|uniref:F-box domain-containing protein n=1 Tax=Mycena maculata TaxID=230809 RepID=A0AAD7I5B0_9AGAR|nr:hypothetical protein DFH07DRAFT_967632 [Mycena maculata]